MKIVIPAIEHDRKHHEFENILVGALLELKNKTGYDGWVEDDEGNIIRGTV